MLVAGRGLNVDVAVIVASLRAMTETATATEETRGAALLHATSRHEQCALSGGQLIQRDTLYGTLIQWDTVGNIDTLGQSVWDINTMGHTVWDTDAMRHSVGDNKYNGTLCIGHRCSRTV